MLANNIFNLNSFTRFEVDCAKITLRLTFLWNLLTSFPLLCLLGLLVEGRGLGEEEEEVGRTSDAGIGCTMF